jgi:hypothetical protein
MVMQVDRTLLKLGRIDEGAQVVIVAGSPPGIAGSTNALRIHVMGDALHEVAPAYSPATRGTAIQEVAPARRGTPATRQVVSAERGRSVDRLP